MRNFKNNRRRYRSNSYDRSIKLNTNDQNLQSNLGNISDFRRKNFQRSNVNSPKLIQKYSDLAREALSTGDKILYESYLQYAEHFIRQSHNTTENGNSTNKFNEKVSDLSLKKIDTEDQENKKEDLQAEKN
mgnify:CR=1 FL=1